jgi:hypothetical protein
VGERSVRRARRILEAGDEALLAAVDEGLVSVNDATRIVKRSHAVQRGAVEAVRAGKAKTAAAGAEQIERTRPTQRSTGTRRQGHWPGSVSNEETIVVRRRDLERNVQCLRELHSKVTKIRGKSYLHAELDNVLAQIASLQDDANGILAAGDDP